MTMEEPTTEQLQELLAQLTTEEKIGFLAGKNVWETNGVERLGIPSLKVTDGPNGARGGGFFDGTTAACFPACVSLAATFDRTLAHRVGVALGQEAQTKKAYAVLGPTVCGHRSPMGGRNFEAFSEDPLLSGVLAAEYVKGLQSERVAATLKHFVANEQDTRRFTVNETISERALREIYLKPFEIVVKTADPWSVMTSYPKVNGFYVDAQPKFIQDVLRKEWGYKGLVMSDWGATSNHVESIKHGLDLEMPGPPRHRTLENVSQALSSRLVSMDQIDRSVLANLEYLVKVGKFTRDRFPSPSEEDEKAVDRPEHRALIREAATDGIVLLKNKDDILPLDPKRLKKVAVIGPLAKQAAAHGGGSASLNCHYKTTPYDSLVSQLSPHGVEVSYAQGSRLWRIYPDLEAGCCSPQSSSSSPIPAGGCWTGTYFSTPEPPSTSSSSPSPSSDIIHSCTYNRGFFTSLMNPLATPALSATFTTTFTPSTSGTHHLSFSSLGPNSTFTINSQIVATQQHPAQDAMSFFLGCQEEKTFTFPFLAGEKYDLKVITRPCSEEEGEENSELHLMRGIVSAHVGFLSQEEMERDLLGQEIDQAVEGADVVVCCTGYDGRWETEGRDLENMKLPPGQDDMVYKALEAKQKTRGGGGGKGEGGPRVVVVNFSGVPVAMPWLEGEEEEGAGGGGGGGGGGVDAVLQGWYGGQEVGNAVADVLLGKAEPGGRLPVSWPRREEDTPAFGNFGWDGYETREVEYVEGVEVGYRYFDKMYGKDGETGEKNEVLFPFGFGLGYTRMEITGAEMLSFLLEGGSGVEEDGRARLAVKVKNVGDREGSEKVQVYLSPPPPPPPQVGREDKGRPPKALVAFDKVRLKPGEEKTVELEFGRDGLAYWHEEKGCWAVEQGEHGIMVATSSRPEDVKKRLVLNVEKALFYGP